MDVELFIIAAAPSMSWLTTTLKLDSSEMTAEGQIIEEAEIKMYVQRIEGKENLQAELTVFYGLGVLREKHA